MALRTFEGVQVVRWVGKELERGRKAGWTGRVLSGYRTDAQQMVAARNFARDRGVSVASLYPNGPLASNHCGKAWPRGAVDVTDARGLRNSLARSRARSWLGLKLVWAIDVGFNDEAHFSRTGH